MQMATKEEKRRLIILAPVNARRNITLMTQM